MENALYKYTIIINIIYIFFFNTDINWIQLEHSLGARFYHSENISHYSTPYSIKYKLD